MKKDEKDKALEQVLADIEKQFGKGSVMKLGSDAHLNIEATSTGSITLDVALGVGGYPKNYRPAFSQWRSSLLVISLWYRSPSTFGNIIPPERVFVKKKAVSNYS